MSDPIDKFMRDKLADSCLLPEDIDARLEKDFAGNDIEDFRIPYFPPDARIDPATNLAPHHRVMHRTRYKTPPPGHGKYTQPSVDQIVKAGYPATDATHPYLNPYILNGTTWAELGLVESKKILIVEGELKAACAGKLLQRAAIGIPGCYGGTVRDPITGIVGVHPVIKALIRRTDLVEVVLDGDILTNPDVNRAAGTLKRALERLGVKPLFVILPAPVQGRGAGLDDWLRDTPDADRKRAFEALPRVDGEDFAEDLTSAADAFGLVINPKTGLAVPNPANVRRLLEKHPRYTDRYYYDVMRGNLYRIDKGRVVPFTDSCVLDEMIWLQEKFGMNVSKQLTMDSLTWMAEQPRWRRNLLLESLPPWDGVPRMEAMFVNGWGADDNDYTRAVGKNWLVSAMARASTPGCKVDTMLVLIGGQGTFKTKSLEALAGNLYVATHAQVDNKDFTMILHRGWMIDLAELSSMSRNDSNQIKGVITNATDFIRLPYTACTVEKPRHSIMVGTTNEDRFLRDHTGNRRFWPLACGTINIKWIAANRDQLCAEALAAYRAGQEWWDMPQSTAAIQEARLEVGPWDEPLRQFLSANEHALRIITVSGVMYRFITNEELLDALNIEVKFRKSHMYNDLRHAMNRISKQKWRHYQYRGVITLSHGGTADEARGYRAPVSGNPTAVVVDFPPKQNPF